MDMRRIRPIRIVTDAGLRQAGEENRPPEDGYTGRSLAPLALRLLALAWAGAIVAALLDAMGSVPHLPLMLALGLTGLFAAASFLLGGRGREPGAVEVPRGRPTADDASDPLTELPILSSFNRALGDEFANARRSGRPMAIVLIDVNNVSAVNKEYGAVSGDAVLRHVARSLSSTKRYNDTAARMGDDEFAVLLIDTGEVGVRSFVDRLETRLASESLAVEVQGREISLWAGVSTGYSVIDPGISTADRLLEEAVASLERTKQEREQRRRAWRSA